MRAAVILVLLAACGGGSSEQPKQTERYRLPAGFKATGVQACDETIRLTYCSWDKQGASPETRQSFEDKVASWRKDLGNTSTRSHVVEECMRDQSAANSGAATGCR